MIQLSLPLFVYLKLKLLENPVRLGFLGKHYCARLADSVAISEIVYGGEYDFLDSVLLREESLVVVDLGANIGLFSLLCFAKNPKARILSVEADPATYMVLQKTRALNPELSWALENVAAHGADGVVSFVSTKSSAASRVEVKRGGSIVVPSSTFGSLRLKWPAAPVDLMKIDIEGSELAFLESMSDPLRDVRALVIEIHPAVCDELRVRRIIRARYPFLYRVTHRSSSKPVLVGSDQQIDHRMLELLTE